MSPIIKDAAIGIECIFVHKPTKSNITPLAEAVEWSLIFFYVLNNVSVQPNEILCLDFLRDNNTKKM